MGLIENLAAKAAMAKATQGGNFIKPGGYLFEIQKLIADQKRGGNMFIVEFKVLEATKTDPTVDPNPVGSSCSYVVNLDKDSGPGDMKKFIMVALDEPEDQITTEAIVEVLKPEQPLQFFTIRDEAYQKPKKSKPTEMFTHHNWQNVPVDAEALKKIQAAQALARGAK